MSNTTVMCSEQTCIMCEVVLICLHFMSIDVYRVGRKVMVVEVPMGIPWWLLLDSQSKEEG